MSGELVIVGAMQIMVPLIVVLALDSIPVLAMLLHPIACIIGMKNISMVSFVPTLVVLQLGGGHAAGL
jgi:hypothetical protein